MQGQNTLYGDGIVDQGAITTVSELSSMVSKDRRCVRATQSRTERNQVRSKEWTEKERTNWSLGMWSTREGAWWREKGERTDKSKTKYVGGQPCIKVTENPVT